MNLENIEFEFKGFDPDYGTKSSISSIAESLHFSAPSDSAMKLVFSKGKGVVEASCRIASCAGTFAAEAMSDNPVVALWKVHNIIRRKLNNWKEQRFDEVKNSNLKFNNAI